MTENLAPYVPIAIWMILAIIPSVRLLQRLGKPVALAVLNLIPVLGTAVLLWILAYSHWPRAGEAPLAGNVRA